MSSTSKHLDRKRARSAQVLLGPPGLFLALTLAALVAAIYISQSTPAAATPRPAPTAAQR